MRDSGILLVPALIIAAVYVLQFAVALHEAHDQSRRQEMMAAAVTAMDGALAEMSCVTGFVHGLPVTFSLRGRVPRAEVDIASTELLLVVQPRVVPARAVEVGAFRTGDPDFDAEMYVEGAPADVVRTLLGPELRARILSCRPMELVITATTVEAIGQPSSGLEVAPLIELVATTAAAVPQAVDEADRLLTQVSGSPYRPSVDASALHGARAVRAEEVASLIETMRERSLASRRALLLAAVLAGFLVLSLYSSG